MFSRAIQFLLFIATLFVLAAATGTPTTTITIRSTPTPTSIPANQCGTGKTQCCNALERSDGSVVGNLLGLLGVVLQGVVAIVGIHCTPIDILGIGQNECHNKPVCCSNNDFKGLIAIGCVPITISL